MHRLSAAAATLTGLMVATAAVAGPPIEVGRLFPDIAMPAMDDGRPLSIRDFRGKKIVLHVFASW